MNASNPHPKANLLYPPGGILIWMVVFIELLTFGAFLLVYISFRHHNMAAFHQAQLLLDTRLGTLNTLVLLTSGLFMAEGVRNSRNASCQQRNYLVIAWFFGLLFVSLKLYEYHEKIAWGVGFNTQSFFVFYWMLTGFHLVHVVAALLLLGYMIVKFYSKKPPKAEDVVTVGVFWHMCDIIWVVLFPMLYLLH